MVGALLLPFGIALILYGIYKWLTLYNGYFEKRGIPHLKPIVGLGKPKIKFNFMHGKLLRTLY